MALTKTGSKYFTARTEIDLNYCKQLSAHNVTERNRVFAIVLIASLLFLVAAIFLPFIPRWWGLFAIIPAAVWFWTTRSAGDRLWRKIVEPSGLEYLVRNMAIDRTGILETKEETGETTKYHYDNVDNLARSKNYIFLFMDNGKIVPIETTYLTGGTPNELEKILLRACPRLRKGKRSTGVGAFIVCAALTAANLFGWIALAALCIKVL